MIPFRCVVLFESISDFGQLHRWTWIIAFASIQPRHHTYWTTRISNFTRSKCPFCCSLAWLDSILRWCVQFQAQMNLPALAHLRKDVSRDWSTGIPGGRVVVQSEREQFALRGLNQTFSDVRGEKRRNLNRQGGKSDFLCEAFEEGFFICIFFSSFHTGSKDTVLTSPNDKNRHSSGENPLKPHLNFNKAF